MALDIRCALWYHNMQKEVPAFLVLMDLSQEQQASFFIKILR